MTVRLLNWGSGAGRHRRVICHTLATVAPNIGRSAGSLRLANGDATNVQAHPFAFGGVPGGALLRLWCGALG